MPSKPSARKRAGTSAPQSPTSASRHNYGWVDLPCGKRCWFARIPRRIEDFLNYIKIMDAFARDIPKSLKHILCWGADNSSTSSGSSGSTDSDKQVTAIFSKDLTVRRSSAQIAYVYYNEDIPEAKYVTFSDPSTFYMKSRMYDVIEKSGDKPLVVPPQASSPVPPRVQESTQTPTTTHADAVPQTAFEPHINATVQPHPTIQPNPTGQAPGKPAPNKNSTWAQVAAKGGAGPRNRS